MITYQLSSKASGNFGQRWKKCPNNCISNVSLCISLYGVSLKRLRCIFPNAALQSWLNSNGSLTQRTRPELPLRRNGGGTLLALWARAEHDESHLSPCTTTGFDYRHFDRAFSMEKDMGYPNGPRQNASGIDIKKLISNHISFVDSKNDFFIQVADILTGFMRRALRARRVERKILLTLGRLMIGRKRQGVARTVQIVTLDEGQQAAPEHLSARVQTIASTRRSMLKPRRALATRVS
jgi:hypothetical protein